MLKKIVLLMLGSLALNAHSEEYMYPFMGLPSGVEGGITQITELHGVMTMILVYENTTGKDQTIDSDLDLTYYTIEGTKYPLLEDEDGRTLTSLPKDVLDIDVDGGEKVLYWLKFEVPPADSWPIELVLPQIVPVVIEKPEGFTGINFGNYGFQVTSSQNTLFSSYSSTVN